MYLVFLAEYLAKKKAQGLAHQKKVIVGAARGPRSA